MSFLRYKLKRAEAPYIGDSESKIRYLEESEKLFRVLHEHYIEEEFNKLVGAATSLPLDSKLDILRVANAEIIAMSKGMEPYNKLAYFYPKPNVIDSNRHTLKMWNHFFNYGGVILNASPSSIKGVVP